MRKVPKIGGLIAFATFLPLVSFALSASVEFYLRRAVMECSQIVVGKVVCTEPFDRTVRDRVSILLVEQVLYGSFVAGDSVYVNWFADTWYPSEGVTTQMVCGGGSQLNELEGTRALWVLRGKDEIRYSCRPFMLETEPSESLNRYIAAIEQPDTLNPAVAIEMRLSSELEGDRTSGEKCEAFLQAIRAELESR